MWLCAVAPIVERPDVNAGGERAEERHVTIADAADDLDLIVTLDEVVGEVERGSDRTAHPVSGPQQDEDTARGARTLIVMRLGSNVAQQGASECASGGVSDARTQRRRRDGRADTRASDGQQLCPRAVSDIVLPPTRASACARRGAFEANGTTKSSKSSIFRSRNRRASGW